MRTLQALKSGIKHQTSPKALRGAGCITKWPVQIWPAQPAAQLASASSAGTRLLCRLLRGASTGVPFGRQGTLDTSGGLLIEKWG